MATFALVHGAGDGGWAWHLVQHSLRGLGHEAVAPDLPTDHDDVTWDDCVEAVVSAVGDAQEVVVVGHSAGGFVVPLAAERLGAALQVYVAGMVPQPGEAPNDWFDAVGWFDAGQGDPAADFFHDVPDALARQATARSRPTSAGLAGTPWPAEALPAIAARFVVTAHDRFIPPAVQRRVAADRLGLAEADELASGHCAALSRPDELAALLARYV